MCFLVDEPLAGQPSAIFLCQLSHRLLEFLLLLFTFLYFAPKVACFDGGVPVVYQGLLRLEFLFFEGSGRLLPGLLCLLRLVL